MSGFSLSDWEASLGSAVSIDDISLKGGAMDKGDGAEFIELETNKIYRVQAFTAKVISKNEVTKLQVTMNVLKNGVPAGMTTIWQELPFQAKDANLNQETIIKLTGMRMTTLGTLLGIQDKHEIANAAGALHDRIGQKLAQDELNGAELFLVKVPQPPSKNGKGDGREYFYTNVTPYAPTKKYGFAEGAEVGASEEAPF